MGWVQGYRERDQGGHVSLYSRNQKDFEKRFPPIAQALAELGRPTILDGEIVALETPSLRMVGESRKHPERNPCLLRV